MPFQIRQHFQIESARFLPNLPKEHPCRQMHGHSFKIIIELSTDALDSNIGWVQDYHEIHLIMQPILKQLDHKVLNEVNGLENPTSELLAKWLYYKIKKAIPTLSKVSVLETSLTECSYFE